MLRLPSITNTNGTGLVVSELLDTFAARSLMRLSQSSPMSKSQHSSGKKIKVLDLVVATVTLRLSSATLTV